MLSYKTKSLLAFLLVVFLISSISVFNVYAEGEDSDVTEESEVLTESSGDNEVESEDESLPEDSEEESSTDSEDSDEDSQTESEEDETSSAVGTEDEDDTKGKTSGGLIGIAVIGGILLLLAIIITISILRKKPFGMKVLKFYKDFKSELKKVVWLSRKETIKQTGVVLTTLIIAIVFLGLLDYLFTKLIQLI